MKKQDSVMKGLTLQNIAKACEGLYIGPAELAEKEVSGIVRDNREVLPGYLFLAIKGERVDGHSFIEDAFEKGALAVLSEQELADPKGAYIKVESTTEAMKRIAAFYRENLQIPVVGITGSVGKTSTKEMIASVLEQKYCVWKTQGNYNNEIGLPLTIFGIRECHEVAVLEMGISDFGEMHRLAEMAKPDIGVITNIGWCHLENLESRDGILKAKTEMFDFLSEDGVAILNADDDKLITKALVNGQKPCFYGIHEKEATVCAKQVKNLGFEGMECVIETSQGEFDVHISIPGEHNVYNALAATAVGLRLGLSTEEIKKGIESAKTIQGRTNFLKCNNRIVIDDCYNANPVSMKTALEVLSHAAGRGIAVLGDMGELGKEERLLHREVGNSVGFYQIPVLFCAGELAEEYAIGAREKNPACEIYYYKSLEEMVEKLEAFVKEGDTILVKASHFMEFTKVVEALTRE